MNLDFTEALKYTFDDPKWPTKMLVTAVISVVPILSFAAVGYELQIMRNVWAGSANPLPEWDDLQDKFILGLPLGILTLVVGMLFGLVIVVVVFSAYFAGFLSILGVLGQSGRQASKAIGVLVPAYFLIMFIIIATMGAFVLLWNLIYPVLMIRYAKSENWHSFFEIKEIFRFIRERLGIYLLAILVVFSASSIAGFGMVFLAMPSMMIPILGYLITMMATLFFGTLIRFFSAHVYAQVASVESVQGGNA